MARANTTTLLPLDRYAEVMGISLVHFNNLRDDAATNTARPWWTQAAHDELATYIAQAEAMLRDGVPETGKPGLGFDVAPTYRLDHIPFTAAVSPWWETATRTPYGYVQAFGSRTAALIEANAAVSYATSDLGIVTANVPTGTLAEEIQVFYRVADGAAAAGDLGWRIRNVRVTVDGTTATIQGHKALYVKLSVLAASTPAEYSDVDSFVTSVDVYRVTTDSVLPVTLVWDAYVEQGSGDPSADYTMTGTARIVNAKLGCFQPRPVTYDGSAHAFAYPAFTSAPERLEVAYLAGYPLADASAERLDGRLEMAVVRLANVLSPDFAHWLNDPAQLKWRRDRLLPNGDNPLQPGEQDCPFGLTDGARFAWRTVRQMRLERMPF